MANKKKVFILDTNVLVHDPNAYLKFKNHLVVLPIIVIEELDNLKNRPSGAGLNARITLRNLDALMEHGSLFEGVKLKNGATLKIEVEYESINFLSEMFERKNDNFILGVAKKYAKDKKISTILVSKDINVRIKADALNIVAQDYEASKVDIDELFKGYKIIYVTKKFIEKFLDNGGRESVKALPKKSAAHFFPNEMILLKEESTRKSILTKYSSDEKELVALFHQNITPWGITARNLEQKFAIELLLSEDIKLVTLVGKAGTGKTLLALATGLLKVVDEKKYERLLVARPIVPMGKDIGYLPGSKEDKLQNWMQPVTDNLEFLFSNYSQHSYQYLMDQKLLEIEALTYIRGRSLPRAYIIIDEAQNLSPHEVKTIVTRAGKDTKIVLTGDPHQIDSQYLDESSNGLSYIAEKMKSSPLSGHIYLQKGERSELATLAAELL
ncbi:PhoH family protein [bacterium]|nr:PhoH family protein [bacterium]